MNPAIEELTLDIEPKSRNQLWSGLELATLPSWRATHDGRTFCCNPCCRKMLDLKTEEGSMEDIWNARVHPDDRERWLSAWSDLVAGRSDRLDLTIRWLPRCVETSPEPQNAADRIAIRAHRLRVGKETQFQGWIRAATGEQALRKLEALARGRA